MTDRPIDCLSAAQLENLCQLYRDEGWSNDRQPADVRQMLARTNLTLSFCTESEQFGCLCPPADRLYLPGFAPQRCCASRAAGARSWSRAARGGCGASGLGQC